MLPVGLEQSVLAQPTAAAALKETERDRGRETGEPTSTGRHRVIETEILCLSLLLQPAERLAMATAMLVWLIQRHTGTQREAMLPWATRSPPGNAGAWKSSKSGRETRRETHREMETEQQDLIALAVARNRVDT